MTSARITKLLLLFALTITPLCAAQQAQNQPLQQTNPPIPLQLTIRQTSPELTFQVELHNTGKEPLDLDHPLGNKGDYYTTALQLTDGQGKKRWLTQRESGCDERVTKCYYVGILPAVGPGLLQPGQTYSFSVDLKNFYPPPTPGGYTLQAIHTPDFSEPAVFPSRVISNTLPFTIPVP